MRKIIFFLLGLILIPALSFSQIQSPVKWFFKVEQTKPDEVSLLFTAKADKGWHFYSQYNPLPPDGPISTSFTFTKSSAYALVGKVVESKPKEEKDPQFDNHVLKYFEHEAVFKQKIRILSKKDFEIKGVVEFMCCNDMQCIPPDQVDFTFPVKGNSALTAETTLSPSVNQVIKQDSSVPVTVTKVTPQKPAAPAVKPPSEEPESLWAFFLVALSLGFLGALTPCVYPMIPMTVSFFMSSSKSKTGAKINALFYGISIIVIYTFIGVLFSILFGPDFIKNISTHWITNIIFFLLFVTFAASFFGLFEIVLPSKLTNKADQQVDKGGLIGTFFMALTLVLVSFSCTAPFVGGILVKAATGNIFKPTVGMFGFSVAFAIPFTILAFFPSLLNKMPKSGGWLNSVKIVMGFGILALGMSFLNVPNQNAQVGYPEGSLYCRMDCVVHINGILPDGENQVLPRY